MTFTGRVEDVARLAGASVAVTAGARRGGWPRRRGAGRRDGRRTGAHPRGGAPALPRGARARREPPGHAGARLRRHPGARPGVAPRRAAGRAAAVGRAGQRAAPRRPRAHRPGAARRRRHRPHPPARARRRRPRPGRRPTGCWPRAPPPAAARGPAARARRARTCSPPSRRTDVARRANRAAATPRRAHRAHQPRRDRSGHAGAARRRAPRRARADDGRAARGPPRADPARPPDARRRESSPCRSSSTRCSSGRTRTSRATRAPSDADLAVCREEGVELVFTPGRGRHVPRRAPTTAVDPGPLGTQLEGAVRPGHFAGVLTVVAKLFHIVAPGRRVLRREGLPAARRWSRRWSRDLDFPLAVVGVPTVREPDGLALSSPQRLPLARAAPARRDPAAGAAGRGGGVRARAGGRARRRPRGARRRAGAGRRLPGAARSRPRARPARPGRARLLVAARLGTTRLIDNIAVQAL